MAGEGPINSGIPILGPILDALSALFSNQERVQSLAQSVDQVEQHAWANMINVAGWSYGLFGGVVSALGDAIKKIGSALEHILKDIIFGHLLRLIQAIRKFLKHLHDLIAPLVKELQTLQRQYNQIVGKQMRRYLDLIQKVRRLLVPFRLLHLGFAKKLDAKLVQLESDAGRAWAKVIAHQNEVVSTLEAIIDPRQLMRPGHTLGSIGTMVAAVSAAVKGLSPRELLCLADPTAAEPFTELWMQYQPGVIQQMRSHAGEYGAAERARDTTTRSLASDLGLVGPL